MRKSESYGLLFCAAVVTALILFPTSPAYGQDDLAQAINDAREQYIVSDWEVCVETVNRVIAIVEASDINSLDTETEAILINAYELRALANFNLNQEEAAREDFKRILSLRPLHKLTPDFSFPLIAEFFEGVREETVGYLTISTTPSGARAFLNETDIGLTDLVRLPLLAGEHSIRLEKTGYAVAQQVISVAPNVETTLTLALERTTASVEIWTSPSDVEVYLDGVRQGITGGTAEEVMQEAAAAKGIPLENISARFVIVDVSLGKHTLELRKDCYRPYRSQLPEIKIAQDFSISDPIVLEPAAGGIALENVPARARIFINGEEQDRGKMGFEGLCPGEFAVEVLSDFGRFSFETTVEDGKTQSIAVQLRPGMLLATPVYASGEAASESNSWQMLLDAVNKVDSFEVLSPEEPIVGEVRALLEVIRRLEAGESNPSLDSRLHGIVRQLCRNNNAQVIAIPVISEARRENRLRMLFFSYEVARVEAATILLDDERSISRFITQLDNRIPFYGTWHGITAVDTRIHDGPVVLAVQAGSPADRAGIASGQVIVAVDGETISGYRTLQDLLSEKTVGERITLSVSHNGENAEREIVLAQSPMLLPLNNAPVFYTAAIATFSLAAEAVGDVEKLNLARLNSAIALAHFDAWEEAVQYLKRVELGNSAGINQGTVYYLIGRGYEHLGYTTEALDYYNRMLEFENATIGSNDGPQLMPRVRQRISQLQNEQ